MALFMFVLLAILVLISYYIGKKKFLTPWFLLCAVVFASYCLVLVNYSNWNVQINSKFVLYVFSALLAFGLGACIVSFIRPARIRNNKKVPLTDVKYKVKYPINFFLVLSIVLFVLYSVKVLTSVSGSSISVKLRAIYENIVENNYTPGFIYNQMSKILMAIAYINTYRFFLKCFNKNDKISFIKLFIPIIVFFLMAIVATDRNIFLRYGIYFVCLWMLFYYQNCKRKNANRRILGFLVIFVAVALVMFFIMGLTKQYTSGFFDSLCIYAGSGLNNFNIWIKDFDDSLLYGQSTFMQTINTFYTLIGKADGQIERFDEFMSFISSNGYIYSSNIFTSLKPYVEDFGYLGVIIFPLITGMFYQWLYVKTRENKYSFIWIVYCALIYPVFFFPILEQLYRRLHLGFIYEIGWLAILYFSVFGRKKLKQTKRTNIEVARIKNNG